MKHKNLFFMYIGSFVAMFITMYAMVAEWSHVYININKVYMALLMIAAMGIVNGLVMGKMYSSKKIRWTIIGGSVLATALIVWLIRAQSFVDNRAFLKSMIPHHSSAILVCEQANITDATIEQLCKEIVQTQKQEIQIMETMLSEKY